MIGQSFEPRNFNYYSVANVSGFGEEGAERRDGFAVAAIEGREGVDWVHGGKPEVEDVEGCGRSV